jgi:hypothetical protein
MPFGSDTGSERVELGFEFEEVFDNLVHILQTGTSIWSKSKSKVRLQQQRRQEENQEQDSSGVFELEMNKYLSKKNLAIPGPALASYPSVLSNGQGMSAEVGML